MTDAVRYLANLIKPCVMVCALMPLNAVAETKPDGNIGPRINHPFYVNVMAGQARGSVGSERIDNRMAELGYDIQVDVSGLNRGAWGVLAGYHWSPYFSAEAGFIDLGEVRTRLSGPVADMDDYLNSANQVHPRSISGLELALLAHFPLGERLNVFARGGVIAGSSRYRASAGNNQAARSDHDQRFAYGVGVMCDLNARWALRGYWNRYRVEGESIELLAASLSYRFGFSARRTQAAPVTPAPEPVVTPEPSPAPEPPVSVVPVSMTLEVNFETGSHVVRQADYPEIQRLADLMHRYPDASVVIEGHTDVRGDAAYNRALSQRRADAVRDILVVQMGVNAVRVESIGHGKSRPLYHEQTPEAHAANRRTVAVIQHGVDQ